MRWYYWYYCSSMTVSSGKKTRFSKFHRVFSFFYVSYCINSFFYSLFFNSFFLNYISYFLLKDIFYCRSLKYSSFFVFFSFLFFCFLLFLKKIVFMEQKSKWRKEEFFKSRHGFCENHQRRINAEIIYEISRLKFTGK